MSNCSVDAIMNRMGFSYGNEVTSVQGRLLNPKSNMSILQNFTEIRTSFCVCFSASMMTQRTSDTFGYVFFFISLFAASRSRKPPDISGTRWPCVRVPCLRKHVGWHWRECGRGSVSHPCFMQNGRQHVARAINHRTVVLAVLRRQSRLM